MKLVRGRTLADDFQAYLEGRPVAAYPEGLLGRAVRFAKRHKAIAETVAASVVIGLLGAIVALVRIEGERRRAEGERTRAETERTRAEAREREATANLALANQYLARVFHEKGGRALAANDAGSAEVLLAKSLTLDDGTIRTWGAGAAGQLGDGTLLDSPVPIQVPGLAGFRLIAAGSQFTVASQ